MRIGRKQCCHVLGQQSYIIEVPNWLRQSDKKCFNGIITFFCWWVLYSHEDSWRNFSQFDLPRSKPSVTFQHFPFLYTFKRLTKKHNSHPWILASLRNKLRDDMTWIFWPILRWFFLLKTPETKHCCIYTHILEGHFYMPLNTLPWSVNLRYFNWVFYFHAMSYTTLWLER